MIAWDVVNEAFEENGTLRNSFWMQRIGPDYIRMAFQFARAADPAGSAKLYINDFNTEGTNAKANALFNLVRDLKAQGVPIDGVGIQNHLINPFTVQQQHRDNLTRLAGLGVDISHDGNRYPDSAAQLNAGTATAGNWLHPVDAIVFGPASLPGVRHVGLYR